jgi:hypothetical protein
MMSNLENREMHPLNDTMLTGLSIEELESRLQMEELDPRGEMWTGCGCADVCSPEWTPEPECIPYVCWKGTW